MYSEYEKIIFSIFSSAYWEESHSQYKEELLIEVLNELDLTRFPIENIFIGSIKEKIKKYYMRKFEKKALYISLEEMYEYNSYLMKKLNIEHNPNLKEFSTFKMDSADNFISELNLINSLPKNFNSVFKEYVSLDEVKKIYTHIIKFILFSGANSIIVYDRYAFQNILINKSINLLFSILNEIALSYGKILTFNFHSVFQYPKEKKEIIDIIEKSNSYIKSSSRELKKKFNNLIITCKVYIDSTGRVINNHSRYLLFSDICIFADTGIQMLSLNEKSNTKKYLLDINFKLANEYEKNGISEYIAKTEPSYTFA